MFLRKKVVQVVCSMIYSEHKQRRKDKIMGSKGRSTCGWEGTANCHFWTLLCFSRRTEKLLTLTQICIFDSHRHLEHRTVRHQSFTPWADKDRGKEKDSPSTSKREVQYILDLRVKYLSLVNYDICFGLRNVVDTCITGGNRKGVPSF